ncbi:MAG: hypothetical protein R6V50_06765 [Thermoplasmatota archaeon]
MIEKQSSSPKSKRKIAFSLLVLIILVINIIITALIFVDIQVISSPEIVLELDILEINSDELLLQTTLFIGNTNRFDFIIKDLDIITKTETGDIINEIKISGGTIAANTNETYTQTTPITFNTDIPSTLTTQLSGIIGVYLLGLITKTIPLQINMITSLGDTIQLITIPEFSVKADLSSLSNDGIAFTADIDISNPNNFDFFIDDIDLSLKTEIGELIKKFTFKGRLLPANGRATIQANDLLPLTILNAEKITASIDTTLGVYIAGIKKYIDVSTEAEILIPHLYDIFTPHAPTVAFIDADMKLMRKGLFSWGFISNMSLEIINPNPLSLYAKEVTFSIYRDDKGTHSFICNQTVYDITIDKENTTLVPAEIYIPLRSLFQTNQSIRPKLPDGLIVLVEANVTIPGLNDYLWIGVGGYQDLKPFR